MARDGSEHLSSNHNTSSPVVLSVSSPALKVSSPSLNGRKLSFENGPNLPPLSAASVELSPQARRALHPLPAGLISIWVHQGQTGYGIYFKNLPSGEGMVVSKIDANSEASKSGIQIGDQLVMVDDKDIRFDDYHETLILVRNLAKSKMTFVPGTAF